jgi:hypothetical protein
MARGRHIDSEEKQNYAAGHLEGRQCNAHASDDDLAEADEEGKHDQRDQER